MRSSLRTIARSAVLGAFLLPALAAAQGADLRALGAAQDRSRDEYAAVVSRIALSQERTASLAAEIATVRKDQETLSRALLDSAAEEKALSARIEEILDRMEPLKAAETRVRLSLLERRDVLAEVLGALQRMGLNPPPAMLVAPEDALSSVRSAILLGAVVPALRTETDRLVADLDAARALSLAIEKERDELAAAVEAQAAERRRLGMLIGEKQRLGEKTKAELLAERWNAAELGARAGSLKELIARMDAEAQALDRERRAVEEKRRRDLKLASLPVPEANRLVLSNLFGSLRGRLELPAQGRFSNRFGEAREADAAAAQGDTLATQSGAIVYAPADAGVLYAGPFRSYGQLLILDAGDGYHVVLAGMDRIDVGPGQSVLAGEPVGAMDRKAGSEEGNREAGQEAEGREAETGEARRAGAAPVIGQDGGPQLYIEFRKDGQPVDPAPWWAKSPGWAKNSGRKRNAT